MGRTLREQLTERITALEEVRLEPSRFGSKQVAFWCGRREFAHFHDGRELDLRLSPARQKELRDHRLAVPRRGRSPWIALRLRTAADLDEVLAWVQVALEEAR